MPMSQICQNQVVDQFGGYHESIGNQMADAGAPINQLGASSADMTILTEAKNPGEGLAGQWSRGRSHCDSLFRCRVQNWSGDSWEILTQD